MTAYTISAVGWTVGMIALLRVLVHGIDALDRWGRKAHPTWIVVPECETSNVVVLDERRTA